MSCCYNAGLLTMSLKRLDECLLMFNELIQEINILHERQNKVREFVGEPLKSFCNDSNRQGLLQIHRLHESMLHLRNQCWQNNMDENKIVIFYKNANKLLDLFSQRNQETLGKLRQATMELNHTLQELELMKLVRVTWTNVNNRLEMKIDKYDNNELIFSNDSVISET